MLYEKNPSFQILLVLGFHLYEDRVIAETYVKRF